MVELQLTEVTHRLVNMLQLLIIGIERQRRLRDTAVMQDELDTLLASARASTELHRLLLPPRAGVDVDLAAFLATLSAAIESVTGLWCEVDAEAVIVPGQVASRIAAAVNELAWNAYKHAYGAQVEGNVIWIRCRRDTQARLLVSVSDRGAGLPAGFDPRVCEGIGLRIVFDTARQLGGEVWAESDGGASFTLLVPLRSLAKDEFR